MAVHGAQILSAGMMRLCHLLATHRARLSFWSLELIAQPRRAGRAQHGKATHIGTLCRLPAAHAESLQRAAR